MPELDQVQAELSHRFAQSLLLWPRDRVELAGFGGEMDRAVRMPGWTNVWTMPIQNRVDMLATGVNTTLGVRVLGRRQQDVVRASEDIAAVLKTLPGAADVIADPVRGKGYLEVVPDRDKGPRLGVDAGTVNDLVEIALGGRVVTTTVEGRERHPGPGPICRQLPRGRGIAPRPAGFAALLRGAALVPLAAVADVRIVEGPASIKGENGLAAELRPAQCPRSRRDASSSPRRGRPSLLGSTLPDGVFVEWTGQFEHEVRARPDH